MLTPKSKMMWKTAALLSLSFVTQNCGRQPASKLNDDEADFLAHTGMKIAGGYDSLNGKGIGECVTKTPLESSSPGADGSTSAIYIKVITDKNELKNVLGIGGHASGGFLIGSFSAKADFAKKSSLKSETKNLLVYQRIAKTTKTMSDPQIKPQYLELLKNPATAMTFYRSCGNAFVSGTTTGGEIYMLLTLESQNQEDKTTFNSEVEGNVAGFSGGINIDTVNVEKMSRYHFSSQVYQSGGADHSGVMTFDEAVKKIRGFAADVEANPRVYSAVVSPYLTAIQDNIAQYAPGIDKIEDSMAQAQKMMTEIEAIHGLLVQSEEILNHSQEYEFSTFGGMDGFKAERQKFLSAQSVVAAELRKCVRNAQCEYNKFTYTDYRLPLLALPFEQRVVVSIPTINAMAGQVTGDAEFLGSPMLRLWLSLKPSPTNVEFAVSARWEETAYDHTTGLAEHRQDVYTAPAGYEILEVSNAGDRLIFEGRHQSTSQMSLSLNNHAPYTGTLNLFGDGIGHDVGKHTKMDGNIKFDMTVKLRRIAK